MRADDFRIAFELELIRNGYAPGRKPGEYVFPPGYPVDTDRSVINGYSYRNRARMFLIRRYVSPHLDEYLHRELLPLRSGSFGMGGLMWSVWGPTPEQLLDRLPVIIDLDRRSRFYPDNAVDRSDR